MRRRAGRRRFPPADRPLRGRVARQGDGLAGRVGSLHPALIADLELRANDIVVPIEGAGGHITSTVSSPMQVHGVAKVPARRAPELGEHSDEILAELGFDAPAAERLRASGAVPTAKKASVA